MDFFAAIDGTSVALIAALITAAIGPLASYIIATRKLSGKIATSEASSLWKESESIRSDYRSRLTQSEERVARLEERVARGENRNNELIRENFELNARNAEYERVINDLRARISRLEGENVSLKAEISILRKEPNAG